jgi:hypothetical protein
MFSLLIKLFFYKSYPNLSTQFGSNFLNKLFNSALFGHPGINFPVTMGESAARGADKEVENKCFKRIQEFKKLQM